MGFELNSRGAVPQHPSETCTVMSVIMTLGSE